MADVVLTVTIPDGLVGRSVNGLSWHYGYTDENGDIDPPATAVLKDKIEEDVFEQIAKWVASYEGSVAGDAARESCLDAFGF